MKLAFSLLSVLIICFQSTNALELDEKLTTRFLKVSRTKKTVLLNRGLEDGIVVGDHAKFFLTTGVIARGSVVKASPTRSIWSIYRIINDSRMIPDSVVNIKITSPLNTTTDPSRSLYDESNATMTAGTEVMTLRGDSRGTAPARVRGIGLNDDEKRELDSLGTVDMAGFPVVEGPGLTPDKTLEAYGLIHFNSLSSSVDEGDAGSFVGQDANIDFSLGLEKYFNNPNSFLSKVSFFALFHSSSNSITSAQGQQTTTSVTEYGVGAHFHYIAPALSYNRLIGFAGVSLGVGSVTDTIDVLSNNSAQTSNTLDGSSSFLSLATGIKYYTRQGFGARAMIDFYRRSESYQFDDTDSFTKVVSGPRLLLGLSYRF
ncbi:MAG: hypothetical protein K9K67_04400 [Bacteriovoracaceae bacterium]|nr:hypothetical protein [Bacteriovoracaceae bacterium]